MITLEPTDLNEEALLEVAGIRKAVVRDGAVKYKVECPDGFRYDTKTSKCVRITAAERMAMKRRSKKAVRTRKAHAGINRIHAAKSLRISKRISKSRNVANKPTRLVS